MSRVSVQVVREYHVPAARVFNAWLDPRQVGRWMFGPAVRAEQVLRIEIDARVGGTFSFMVQRGENVIDHIGEYLEISPHRRLVFSWGIAGVSDDESRVLIDITPTPQGCRVLLTHEMQPQWAPFTERAGKSWQMMLDKLAELVAT